MRFEPLPIAGACNVTLERLVDQRGFFARTFCRDEFEAHGLPAALVQASTSYNEHRGTVRGMHFQWPPSAEGKLVRCVRGRIFDVLLDLRPESKSYLEHVAVTLDCDGREAVYVPPGVAHGFQTLVDGTEVHYQMSDVYAPDLAAGVRWNDSAFGISWPITDEVVLSERDRQYPDFAQREFEAELARRSGAPAAAGAAR